MFDLILLFSAITGGAAALVNTIGASIYDIGRSRELNRQARHPFAKLYRQRPKITLVIYADNSTKLLSDTFGSLFKSSYRKLQIVVADNASNNGIKALVKTEIKANPKRQIGIYSARSHLPSPEIVRRAVKKYADGELLFLLPAGAKLEKHTLTRAAGYFKIGDRLQFLSLNQQVETEYSVAGFVASFGRMLSQPAVKTHSLLNNLYSPEQMPAFYRTEFYRRSKSLATPLLERGDRAIKIAYAHDVVVYMKTKSWPDLASSYINGRLAKTSNLLRAWRLLVNKQNPDHRIRLTWLFYPGSLILDFAGWLWPISLSYLMFLAFGLKQPDYLLLMWVSLLLLTIAVLVESSYGIRQKMTYVFMLPLVYSWLYITAILQVLAVFVGLFRSLTLRSLRPRLPHSIEALG